MLHGAVQRAHIFGDGQRPPALLGQADAVLAGDRALPGDDLGKQFVQSPLAAPLGARLVEINHDIGVDVAIPRVAETGDAQAVLALEARGEGEQVFQPAARDDDVLVQLGQAGVTQGVGELAPNLPDGFALILAEADFDEQRLLGRDELLKVLDLAAHGAFAGRRVPR